MDKKVWAIVGVIVLHLALMLFFRGTLKPEELAQTTNREHPDAAPIQPNPFSVPNVSVTTAFQADGAVKQPTPLIAREASKQSRAEVLSRKQTIPIRTSIPDRPVDSKTVPNRAVAVAPPVWQDTVIWIRRTEVQPIYQQPERAVVIEPKVSPAAAADVSPVKKKRSFFKKVVPVIRKPYDWIKTLVSKL